MARYDVDVTNAQQVGDFACEPKFFVGHASRRDDGDVCAAELPKLERCLVDGAFPISRREFFAVKNLRLEQAVVRFQIFEIQSAVIAHPARVHVIVLARRLSINDVLARADEGIAAGGAARANAFRFF